MPCKSLQKTPLYVHLLILVFIKYNSSHYYEDNKIVNIYMQHAIIFNLCNNLCLQVLSLGFITKPILKSIYSISYDVTRVKYKG